MRLPNERRKERGAIAILAAVVLMVVGGFLALSLNVGHRMNAKTQLQGAFDAAALAGAMTLNGQPSGIANAPAQAVKFAEYHYLDSSKVGLGTSDVTVGYWDKSLGKFFTKGQSVTVGDNTFTLDTDATAQYFNAVKLGATTDGLGSHNQELDVWFGAFLGRSTGMKIWAGAIAVGGGPCTDTGCTLPLAVPSCAFVDSGGYVLCDTVQTFTFNAGHGKDIWFVNVVDDKNPGNSEIEAQMKAGASCTNPTVTVGDTLTVQNGNDFNKKVADAMTFRCTAAAPYTGCERRQVAVFDIGPHCESLKGNPKSGAVVGFARIVLLDTNPGGKDASIKVYIDCTGDSTEPGGCANFGYGSTKLRLVQ